MHYKLIFKGEVAPDVSLEQGQATLAKLFKLDLEQSAHQQKLSKLFTGKSVVIKKDLSNESAQQFKAKLAKLGLICHIRSPEINSSAPIPPIETKPGTDSNFPGIQLSEKPEKLKLDEATVTALSSNQVAADLEAPPNSAENPDGLILVVQEEKLISSSEQNSSQDSEQCGLSLDAMEEKPAKQTHDESLAEKESIGFVSHASNISIGQGASAKGYMAAMFDNTSGSGSGAYLPDEASGWCWGAFFWGWIWSIFNRTWIGLLALIPMVNIPVAVMLGLKGRQWAWQNRQWDDVEHFNRVQRYWSLTGLLFAVLGLWIYWSSLSAMNEMVDEQGVLKEEFIESIQDEKQREALIQFQQQLKEELKKQQALQNN